MYVYGEPDSKQRETYRIMQKTFREGIQHFKPDRIVVEIAQDVKRAFKKNGAMNPLDPEIFIGHHLGYNMVEEPYLASWSDMNMMLKPNMAIAAEWFVLTEYGPILYEENFVVREDGLEMISGKFKEEEGVISINRSR